MDTDPLPKGTPVRIPKGTRITGTFPGASEKLARRTYVVSIFASDNEYTYKDYQDTITVPAKVCWVGAGGYWHYANLDDVEVVE